MLCCACCAVRVAELMWCIRCKGSTPYHLPRHDMQEKRELCGLVAILFVLGWHTCMHMTCIQHLASAVNTKVHAMSNMAPFHARLRYVQRHPQNPNLDAAGDCTECFADVHILAANYTESLTYLQQLLVCTADTVIGTLCS